MREMLKPRRIIMEIKCLHMMQAGLYFACVYDPRFFVSRSGRRALLQVCGAIVIAAHVGLYFKAAAGKCHEQSSLIKSLKLHCVLGIQ